MEKITEWKPCPFCGSTDIKVTSEGSQFEGFWSVAKCVKCGASVSGKDSSEKAAIEAWNRRVNNG